MAKVTVLGSLAFHMPDYMTLERTDGNGLDQAGIPLAELRDDDGDFLPSGQFWAKVIAFARSQWGDDVEVEWKGHQIC